MPRLRRLSGAEVIRILQEFGFEIIGIKGSHYKLRRVIGEQNQTLHIPVHGKQVIAPGTLRAIYRQACVYIPEDELFTIFYTG